MQKSLLNVSYVQMLSIQANEGVFSRNEQQKVYLCPGIEGEKRWPLDHMWQILFHSTRFITSSNHVIYHTEF